jgi:hypothetical protein
MGQRGGACIGIIAMFEPHPLRQHETGSISSARTLRWMRAGISLARFATAERPMVQVTASIPLGATLSTVEYGNSRLGALDSGSNWQIHFDMELVTVDAGKKLGRQ